MTYKDSIRRIASAEANYYRLCELADTDDAIGEALEILWRAKAEHKAKYGFLLRQNGEWI
jgi:hypothetical protein